MRKILRILIAVISWILLLCFIAPAMYGVFNIGSILGIILCLCVIFRCQFSGVYHKIKDRLLRKKAGRALLRTVQTASVLFIIYAVVISALMIGASLIPPYSKGTAIVLGAQVKGYGPSAMLSQRIDAAYAFLETPGARAVCSGGQGADEPISEGECIYGELVSMGAEEDRLLIEDQSTNTRENIRFSYRLIKEKSFFSDDGIAIVSDSFHQLRARIICRKEGVTEPIGAVNAVCSPRWMVLYPAYFVREWLAIPAELFLR